MKDLLADPKKKGAVATKLVFIIKQDFHDFFNDIAHRVGKKTQREIGS